MHGTPTRVQAIQLEDALACMGLGAGVRAHLAEEVNSLVIFSLSDCVNAQCVLLAALS